MSARTALTLDQHSLARNFEALTTSAPDAPAVIDGHSGVVTSRARLLERAEAIFHQLRRAGATEGSIVAIQLPNSVDFIATVLAIVQSRMTMIPVDRDARESEVTQILSHFGARAIARREGGTIEITPCEGSRTIENASYIPLVKLTSGSTGLPKGILTSERNLAADCINICKTMGIRRDDLNLGAIPFSHSYGFSNLVTPLLLTGTPIVATNQYLPLSILELANRFGCTVLPGIPMMYDHLAQLADDDGSFTSVRTMISAGAPLRAEVSSRFRARFGIDVHSFYGCSECGGIAYDREGGSVERGTVGPPMSGVTLTIENDGRLIVESDAVARGYLSGVEGEDERFGARSYRTDDLARWTATGEVELFGRAGDFINTAGKKVNPREIEQIVLQLQGIREVKAYGAAAGARGEVVAVAAVADPGVTAQMVRVHCKQHLSSWKVPRIVKIIDRMPLDERGKLKRAELEKM